LFHQKLSSQMTDLNKGGRRNDDTHTLTKFKPNVPIEDEFRSQCAINLDIVCIRECAVEKQNSYETDQMYCSTCEIVRYITDVGSRGADDCSGGRRDHHIVQSVTIAFFDLITIVHGWVNLQLDVQMPVAYDYRLSKVHRTGKLLGILLLSPYA
jgi:hypothetical protein